MGDETGQTDEGSGSDLVRAAKVLGATRGHAATTLELLEVVMRHGDGEVRAHFLEGHRLTADGVAVYTDRMARSGQLHEAPDVFAAVVDFGDIVAEMAAQTLTDSTTESDHLLIAFNAAEMLGHVENLAGELISKVQGEHTAEDFVHNHQAFFADQGAPELDLVGAAEKGGLDVDGEPHDLIAEAKALGEQRGRMTTVELLEAVMRYGDGAMRDHVIHGHALDADAVAQYGDELANTSSAYEPPNSVSVVLNLAEKIGKMAAKLPNDDSTLSDHLLVMLAQGNLSGKIMETHGADHIANDFMQNLQMGSLGTPQGAMMGPGMDEGEDVTPMYRDLVEAAKEGKLDPVVGREDEIRRMEILLARKTKGSVAIIGEAGVGKTALVEGLAQRIASGKVHRALRGRPVLALDGMAMVAGSKYRGQFEERIKNFLEYAKENNAIIFMDELHQLVGMGSAEGASGAGDLIKPMLARGEIKVVGATTLDEYRDLEKDSALERRFSSIRLDEPDREATVEVLETLREGWEEHHRVKISDEALDAAYDLSDRHMFARNHPDKDIDLVDEAASELRIRTDEAAEAAGKSVEEAEAETPTLTREDVEATLVRVEGIPKRLVAEDRIPELLKLEDSLSKNVFGQDEAINSVAEAILMAEQGFNKPGRPKAVMAFVGPVGVGKTELALDVATQVFGNDAALININGGGLQHESDLTKLIGSSAGYVGYDDAAGLTEGVRRRPHSVVFIDEFHLVHPKIQALLLKAIDEGKMADAKGLEVHFNNTIFILAGTFGLETNGNSPLGFAVDEEGNGTLNKAAQENYEKNVGKAFSSRVDLVNFHTLDGPSLQKVARKVVGIQSAPPFAKKGVELEVTDAVYDYIVEELVKSKEGGRHAEKWVRNFVNKPLSGYLARRTATGGKVTADLDPTGDNGEPSIVIRDTACPQVKGSELRNNGTPAADCLPSLSGGREQQGKDAPVPTDAPTMAPRPEPGELAA